ncbi:MAG: Dam family site-specific DNA-(adenine-N6)-methyltransferase, partial [Hyphomicrobiales bacterium]
MSKNKGALQPFLKWTGGKRWAVKDLKNLIPESYGRYFEPFLGGGALFFHLKPYPATLSDTNLELINTYRQVRDECEQVVSRLQRLPICRDQFLKIRASRPRTNINKAVRFLFLNRTAYNGMFRVNQRGEFNVPFGCKEGTRLCDPTHFRRISKALQNRSIRVSDFEAIIDLAESGDIVYADPPYTTQHNNNGF